MTKLGYFLSSEEFDAKALVRQAQLAEEAGIQDCWISDHYHPWLHSQGESPFVWCVIGGIATTTSLRVTTAVTCPTFRIHPAVLAQAAATAATMLDGRFGFGIGSGEALNEHILGQHWPPAEVRLEMLEEAVEVMRALWTGEVVSHRGTHYTVENARIYTLPQQPPPVYVSGFGPKATDVAARIGDGYVNTSPSKELVQRYVDGGGKGPKMAGMKVCWGEDEETCLKMAHDLWRTSGVPGELSQELPTPEHFEQASELVTPESLTEKIPCGPDPEKIASVIQKYVDAGYDELYINQIGPDQEGFFDMFKRDLAPRFAGGG
jgi:G6PDH family F420-dependent oxidoreductase